MIALVCDTPYQVLSALFLAKHIAPEEPLVFFLNQYWDGTKHKFEIENTPGMFENVIYYGREHMGAALLFTSLCKPERMLRRLSGFSFDYDFSCIIASRTAWMATYLYNWNIQKNPALQFFCIEEGIGEYIAPLPETRFTKACRMLKKTCQTDVIAKAYFSAPELYPYKTYFPVEKLPVPKDLSAMQPFVKALFDGKEDLAGLENYPVVFLNEAPSAGEDGREYIRREKELLDTAARKCGNENMIVKLHPRTDSYNADGIKAVYTKSPLELLPFYTDMNEKTLMGAASTGLFTSKLLYGKEPRLVVLYKLFADVYEKAIPDAQVRQNYLRFMEGVRDMYSDKNRVSFPQTEKELLDALF
ncbi:MAG: hypothetical protein ACOYJB_06790 [Christensenellaceae bacterium]|jgi:hypothetical protein